MLFSSAAAITSASRTEPARLYCRGRACVCGGNETVGEGEKRVGSYNAAFERKLSLFRFPDRDLRAVNARHLPRADSERALAARVDDCIALDVLYDLPAEEHCAPFLVGGLAFGDNLHVFFKLFDCVGRPARELRPRRF